MSKIFNIPAGIPFAKALAQSLLHEHEGRPEDLADILILLPTRRACRTLREAFLRENDGKPILLPRMQALGDIDEDELSLSIAGADGAQTLLDLPPGLPPMRRQLLLARAIFQDETFAHGFDQALALAKALGHLMDQIYTENLDLKDLAGLVPEDFADHWQVTLDFLKILSEKWPDILDTLGMIDAADRRNRLLLELRDFWDAHPPQDRIIAAGTTGSIPATASLLGVIAGLPNGQIVLPGFDTNIDDASWEALGETHPQYGFKHLFDTLSMTRDDVTLWPGLEIPTICEDRKTLAREMMRPAESAGEWQKLRHNDGRLGAALDGLSLVECDTQQHEADIIALLLRGILEEDAKTATLITPDRMLAKRVSTACLRWGITLDDSAGKPLSHTKAGRFFLLIAQACEQTLSPVALLSVLKHPLCAGIDRSALEGLEKTVLRGPKPALGVDGLLQRLRDYEERKKTTYDSIRDFIVQLGEIFTPLLDVYTNHENADIKTILHVHLQTCEALAGDDGQALWSGEEGESLASFLSGLLDHAPYFPQLESQQYTAIMQQFLQGETFRPRYGTHPRLQILGQLEARLIDSDLVILGGLNEGTWPPDPGHDPWMSRPMREEFGLPGAERSIGLAAHDFVQGFCTPHVVMTRAARVDGAPCSPARWLQRLETVLDAAGLGAETLTQNDVKAWREQLDAANSVTPASRPAPCPPVHARPRKMRITNVETWLKDPYSIYARYILGLNTLDPLEKQEDAALRGQVLHDTLEAFVTAYPDELPQNASAILQGMAQDAVEAQHSDPEDWRFFWPRFERVLEGFIDKETQWRNEARPLKNEIDGQTTLSSIGGDFILYGRADRIDAIKGGDHAALIDYKSAGQYSQKGMRSGDLPQLPLEAMILEDGGFDGVAAKPCGYLGYWVLSMNGKDTSLIDDADIVQHTRLSLENLIARFDDENTPYLSLPRAGKAPRYNDYEHLARVKEWAAFDDQEDAA